MKGYSKSERIGAIILLLLALAIGVGAWLLRPARTNELPEEELTIFSGDSIHSSESGEGSDGIGENHKSRRKKRKSGKKKAAKRFPDAALGTTSRRSPLDEKIVRSGASTNSGSPATEKAEQ